MFLTFDVGNTNINIGLYDKEELKVVTRLSTDRKRTPEQYAIEIKAIFDLHGEDISNADGAIISSVVPELTACMKAAVKLLTGANALVLGPGLKNGLNIKIDNPAQLGTDLVAGAVGALKKYPMPCLVLDLGTATKISVLDGKGVYRGCAIGAGIGVSMNALAGSASLLPSVGLDGSDCPSYGTNTVDSMRAGFILGTAAMLDGMCGRIEQSLGEKVATVVATGGLAPAVIKYCTTDIINEPTLILEGLKYIYLRNT